MSAVKNRGFFGDGLLLFGPASVEGGARQAVDIVCGGGVLCGRAGVFERFDLLRFFFFARVAEFLCLARNFFRFVAVYAERFGDARSARFGEVFESGKRFYQCARTLFADAGQFEKNAYGVFFCAEALVSACRKAVGFISHALEQPERVASSREDDRCAVARPVDFFVFFCESRDRDVDAERCEHALHGVHLPDAAVYEQQVGQFSSFVQKARVTSARRFPHRREVVDDAVGRFEAEVAVIFFVGVAVVKADQACDGEFSRDVRDVESFDAHWKRVEGKERFEFFERGDVAPFA